MGDSEQVSSQKASRGQSLKSHKQPRLFRQDSVLDDLIRCAICLEKLKEPKMLPCQHTFCLSCLQAHLNAKCLLMRQQSGDKQSEKQAFAIKCPMCQKKVDLKNGSKSLDGLPKNLYIDSVLKFVEEDVSVASGSNNDKRCTRCQTISLEQAQFCQHCMQVYCNVCWNEHLTELESNLSLLLKQMDESKNKLDHKLENFESRCKQLSESIQNTTLQKIELLQMDEEKVLKDLQYITQEVNTNHNTLTTKIAEIRKQISSKPLGSNHSKVFTFINLHRETSRILSQVKSFAEARIIFDPESFRLDQAVEGIYNEIEDTEENITCSDRFEIAHQQYKNHSFAPKLVWHKCPRPSNVAVPPWNNDLVYIAATDTHRVLILNQNQLKLEGGLGHPEMLYPQGIAFSQKHEEIFVSDKWKHCIHVFSKTGDYLRQLLSKGNGDGKIRSPDGIAMGPNEELAISDSGNDRIIIIDSQTGQHLSTIGLISKKTPLNMPTGIAFNGDDIIVADTGNHRIKIFNRDGRQIEEFGSLGTGRGQFRGAEVVAVDPLGLILVGDGGNARVQVLKPDGTVCKIFGGPGQDNNGFGWISGICVTTKYDIIVTDCKNRCLKIF